jgi:epoxyqueuosine reductase QueG
MIENEIKKILKPFHIDYLGFVDITDYEVELVKFGGDIVRGYKYGISIGIKLPDPIVDGLIDRFDKNVSSLYFTHSYHYINDRLNLTTSVLSSFLNSKSFDTLPIPASERTDIDNAIPTVSHKMIAHLAGLGWIGKSCLLVTPDNGPRVRFSSLLTNAPLKSKKLIMENRCGDCMMCTNICPAKAIKGKAYIYGEDREVRFDFKKCQDYFDELKKDDSRKPICGMCLYACPYGRFDAKKSI